MEIIMISFPSFLFLIVYYILFVVQEESNFALTNPVTPSPDDSSVLVNASDARKQFNHMVNHL
jgi:hypothetical protein